MNKKQILILFLFTGTFSKAQFFEMKKTYTGGHYAFSHFNEDDINKFVVHFNQLWASDLKTGFHQYKGNERGQTFTTSGFRFIFGKEETKWTASMDYAYGFGKDKNEAEFQNGIIQHMDVKFRNNQINFSFGVAKNENKVWLEGLYSTNLGKVIIEYSTEHLNGIQSFGTEYKLNGIYVSTIKTMEFGAQASYKYKKYVFYARAMFPALVIGPGKKERMFVDARSSGTDPKDFPSEYNTYVNDPQAHVSANGSLQSTGFKGLSYGFGMFFLLGKDK
jgi:hypothetical protein